ncbi:MAG TPA: hypothetical protein VFB81_19665 [Myxococcales bacterium]|nr:hypothetical protein [Myxococcales bacterium]
MFHTRRTYNLARLDYLVLLVFCSVLALIHYREMSWGRFLIAFAWIDVVGTLPAYYVYYLRRSGKHRSIPPIFYHLYNFCHSVVTNLVVTLAWAAVTGGWEWAMLGAAIHLTGDRSLFGNIYKPLGLSFEPVALEGFQQFLGEYEKGGRW